MNSITIIDYRPEHQPFFEQFNRQWIEEWFEMEPVDEWVLKYPEKALLASGGAILMAAWDGVIAGTVGLRKVEDGIFEFTKMAVDPAFRRKGIAEALSYASFQKAENLGARRVVLYSNTLNADAIRLYERLGFLHVPVEPGIYKRANVKMVINIEDALRRAHRYQASPATLKL